MAVSTTSRGDLVAGVVVAAGLLVVAATHVGYPALVLAAAHRRRRRPAAAGPVAALPTLTVVIPAHNEERFLGDKIRDVRSQDYPPELVQVVVVDDGSTDGTRAVAEASSPAVDLVSRPDRQGKSEALNAGVDVARGEIVVFTDANGALLPGSFRAIVEPFADRAVGVVSGTKRPVGDGAHGGGQSGYWRLETWLKDAEGVLGTVVGADGGIYAVRRSAWRPIPPGVYADDYHVPLDALRRGWKVGHARDAAAVEAVAATLADEFERRTRIAAGIWRESVANRELARASRGWVAVAFVGHRVLRTMVTPSLLPVVYGGSVVLRHRGRLGPVLFWGQTICWSAAALGALADARLLALPHQFAVANLAALRGGWRYLARRQTALWRSTARGSWQRIPVDRRLDHAA